MPYTVKGKLRASGQEFTMSVDGPEIKSQADAEAHAAKGDPFGRVIIIPTAGEQGAPQAAPETAKPTGIPASAGAAPK